MADIDIASSVEKKLSILLYLYDIFYSQTFVVYISFNLYYGVS